MKITAIEKAKGDRYTVFVDEEYWYILDLEIIMGNGLKPGMDVDAEQLDGLRRQAERRTARERAYYLLGYRDHSCKELYDKLLKSARPEIAAEIVALMQEQGLLDDEKYARKLAAYYLESKRWGSRRVYQELYRRGIDRDTAQAALEDCAVDPGAQIRAIIERKYAAVLEDGDWKARQKVAAALARLGYSYDDINAALAEYQSLDE